MIEDICESVGVNPIEPLPLSKVGIALQTLSQRPIHGLRHPVEGESNGWYIWCGEYLEDDDFLQRLHVEHLLERMPQVLKYLSLPPGYRFFIDDKGYEDIWFDEALLNVE